MFCTPTETLYSETAIKLLSLRASLEATHSKGVKPVTGLSIHMHSSLVGKNYTNVRILRTQNVRRQNCMKTKLCGDRIVSTQNCVNAELCEHRIVRRQNREKTESDSLTIKTFATSLVFFSTSKRVLRELNFYTQASIKSCIDKKVCMDSFSKKLLLTVSHLHYKQKPVFFLLHYKHLLIAVGFPFHQKWADPVPIKCFDDIKLCPNGLLCCSLCWSLMKSLLRHQMVAPNGCFFSGQVFSRKSLCL